MASRQGKKEKHRLRRQKKRTTYRGLRLQHKHSSTTDSHPVFACVANVDWRDGGLATILVAREIGQRRLTMGAFLVDIWAMGLKDAWGRVDISVSDFNQSVSDLDEKLGTCALDVETARHLVYGGIKQARELGFRLPRKYERWTALLGPLPAGVSPDMSLFLKDGKIMLTCSMGDLRERLIGCKVEDFIHRPDVSYIIGQEDFTLVDHEADEFDDMMLDMERAFLDSVKKWCFANGQVPHALLPEVISATLEVISQSAPANEFSEGVLPDMPDDQLEELLSQLESDILARGEHDPEKLRAAVAQLSAYMDSVGSPKKLFESLELDA